MLHEIKGQTHVSFLMDLKLYVVPLSLYLLFLERTNSFSGLKWELENWKKKQEKIEKKEKKAMKVGA